MKYWLRKFPLICLLLLCFILLLSETVCFTAKIFNMHILSMGLHINVCSGVFRTQSNIYGGASLQKSQESFIVDVGLGSNYASGIGFTVENVHRMPIFILYGQNRLQKFIIAFLFLELIENFLV